MQLDARFEPRDQLAARTRQPQAVGAAILAAAALHEAALLEPVDHPHHGRAVEPYRGGEPALRDPGVGFKQEQDADAPRRQLSDTAREVAERRALCKAQAVAEQPRQDALRERRLAARFQKVLLTDTTTVARLRSLLRPLASARQ